MSDPMRRRQEDFVEPLDLRQRRRHELRRDVVAVAVALFLERGFEQVTMDDVADAVGISKRTLFRHFATKEDIVLGDAGRVEESLRKLDLGSLDLSQAVEAIEDVYAASLAELGEDPSMRRVQQVISQSDRLRQAAAARHRAAMEVVRRELDATGLTTGELQGRLVVEITTGTLHAVLDAWAGDDESGGSDLFAMYERARREVRGLMR